MFKIKHLWIVVTLSIITVGTAYPFRTHSEIYAVTTGAYNKQLLQNKKNDEPSTVAVSNQQNATTSSEAQFEPLYVETASQPHAAIIETQKPAETVAVNTPAASTVDEPSDSSTTNTTPSSETAIAPSDHTCSNWYSVAQAAGWNTADMDTLFKIMYAESRCSPTAVSYTGDYGLMQINWYAHSQNILDRGLTQSDLFDPIVNLGYALELASYGEQVSGCKWQPWYSSGYWC